jgi:hypothetical protein
LNKVPEQEANNDTQLNPIDSKEITSDSQDDDEFQKMMVKRNEGKRN